MAAPNRILIVEDDRSIAVTYAVHLVAAGYVVRIAEDGLAAFRHFDEQLPSLVIMDLQLPLVSGFRLLQVMKRASSRIPVLVATSLMFEEAEEVARAGADDFLTKPVDPDLLLHKVKHHLTHRRRPAASASSDRDTPSWRAVPLDVRRSTLPRSGESGLLRLAGAANSRELAVASGYSLAGVRRRGEHLRLVVGD
jgi:DNA-binding response OmpR family regulator